MDSTIILMGSVGFLFIWCVILTVLIAKEKQVFQTLAKGVTKKDLLSVLRQLMDSLKKAADKIETLERQCREMERSDRLHLQKIGFVRFNPFADTGGDQSFCLCLLDQDNNGIVITSLHSRDTTRLYAKHITKTSLKDIHLSQEEDRAYQEAVSHRLVTNSHVKEIAHDVN